MSKNYKAKISYWLVLVVILVASIPFFFSSFEDDPQELLFVIIIQALTIGIMLDLFFRTKYIVEDGKLLVKVSFFSFKPIDITSIKEISKSNSLLSSPAPSLDRIIIKYNKFDEIILSPKNKLEFASDLKDMNPNIKINFEG